MNINEKIDGIMVFLVVCNIILLGSSRLAMLIRIMAIQGLALGLLPLFIGTGDLTIHQYVIAAAVFSLKGMGFPWLLARAQQRAAVAREVEPYVSYTFSLLFGVLALSIAVWLASRLPLPFDIGSSLFIPMALFTIMVGFFLIITRRKALTQVIGYVTIENGIYVFGMALARESPLLVEIGILLDVFVAVFVMGITIFHISREFDHIDTDRLSTLAESSVDTLALDAAAATTASTKEIAL